MASSVYSAEVDTEFGECLPIIVYRDYEPYVVVVGTGDPTEDPTSKDHETARVVCMALANRDVLDRIRAAAQQAFERMNGDADGSGSRPPDGDDYSDLYSLVMSDHPPPLPKKPILTSDIGGLIGCLLKNENLSIPIDQVDGSDADNLRVKLPGGENFVVRIVREG